MRMIKKGHRLWPVLKFMVTMVLGTGLLLVVAQLALTYYGEIGSLRQAFYRARWVWLIWRIVLYSALGYGLWTLYHHPKVNDIARRSLRRSVTAAVAFVVVSELSVWSGGAGL